MPATTTKGAPYPEGSDAPNGAGQIQALAEWLDGVLTGLDQQVLHADTSQPTKVGFKYPRRKSASSVAGLGSGAASDIGYVTTGSEQGRYTHDGSTWVLEDVDLSVLPKGCVAKATRTTNITNINSAQDLLEVTFTAEAGRLYVIQAKEVIFLAAEDGVEFSTQGGFGTITDESNVSLGVFGHTIQVVETTAGVVTQALWNGCTHPRTFTAGSTTVKSRAQRSGSEPLTANAASSAPAWIAVFDVGPDI